MNFKTKGKIFGPIRSLKACQVTWSYLCHSSFGPFWGIWKMIFKVYISYKWDFETKKSHLQAECTITSTPCILTKYFINFGSTLTSLVIFYTNRARWRSQKWSMASRSSPMRRVNCAYDSYEMSWSRICDSPDSNQSSFMSRYPDILALNPAYYQGWKIWGMKIMNIREFALVFISEFKPWELSKKSRIIP